MRRLVLALSMVALAHAAHGAERERLALRRSYDPGARSFPVVQIEKPSAVIIPALAPAPAMPPGAPQAGRGWAFTFEVGARYWYSSGTLAKDLYDDPRFSDFLNSRLTYSGLKSHAAEIYARAEHHSGPFLKGYAGLSNLNRGELNDEDFPPGIAPYSSTLSQQRDGDLTYLSADLGYYFYEGGRVRLGLFAGYHYLHEKARAFGCTQVAGNPFICVPVIATSVLVITEDARWHSARLGILGDAKIAPRLTLTAEAAFVPYAGIGAHDTHWLRVGTTPGSFSGPIPQRGNGYGVQLESVLSYDVTERLNIGIGGRYWYMKTEGKGDLEQTIVGWPIGAASQPLNFQTERYGVFVQAGYRFGS